MPLHYEKRDPLGILTLSPPIEGVDASASEEVRIPRLEDAPF
jgi:hypothetical protein